VTNQLAHRGNAQPNLLKAAARQNAEQIAKLTAERSALVTTQNTLTAQIAAAEKEIAALDAEYATLVGKIDTATMSLTKLESTARRWLTPSLPRTPS
jgi:chromosome segregation ATPase